MDFQSLESFKNAKYIFVIGIGGSILASKAVWSALTLHRTYVTKKVFFLESPDGPEYGEMASLVPKKINYLQDFAILVISKSGETVETLEAFRKITDLFKDFFDYRVFERVVIVTTQGSSLFKLALVNNILSFNWPEGIGGRWSALTIPHLVFLTMAGLDTKSYLEGGVEMLEICEQTENHQKLANLIFENYKIGQADILDFFIFNDELEDLGKWCRQLFAESLGKKNEVGERVGILPTVSIGPQDLHSMLQLSLGGPRNRFTIFIKSEREILGTVNQKAFSDTLAAYREAQLPASDYVLQELNEREVAKFMRFMMEVCLSLALLLKVNPYDQPAVEEYKKNLRTELNFN